MKKINNFELKVIALILMTIDHIGYLLFPDQIILRYIGRISFPIFAFLMAETAKHTSNIHSKINKLLIAGIIAQLIFIPFNILDGNLNIMFTLSGGLVLTYLCHHSKIIYSILFLIFSIMFNSFMPMDYGVIGMLLVLSFSIRNIETRLLSVSFVLMFVNNLNIIATVWSFASLLFIAFYNDKLGTKKYKNLFYIYYPLHLVILYLISTLIK